MKKLLGGVLLAAMVAGVFAQNVAEVVEKKTGLDFDGGADIRARYEFKDNWMDKGKTSVSPASEDYCRMRTRVWGKATYGEDLGAYLRLGNEFRGYRNSPDNDRNKFPDELFIDNLYFDFNNIGDRVDLRVGRQDIKEGSGRLISDGTPGDGSRSVYFNAILAKVKMLEKSDVDLMATWNPYRDAATVGNPHDPYDLTKIRSGSPYSKMDEKGLMAYVHYNEIQDFPMEFYWIWKQETRFYDKTTRYPGRDFHTLGTRLSPKFSDKLSGEVEAAVQVGNVDSQAGMQSRDIFAYMGYAGLTYSEKEVFGKPKLTGALLYMSGDEDSYYKTQDGSTDSGWNPVFNRADTFSQIGAGMYDQFRWSNLIYPHLEASVEPYKKNTVKLQTGPMFAAEKDNGATDSYRGYFTQLRYDFPILSKIFGKRGDVTGAVVGEAMVLGDYYNTAGAGDTATWVRFELNGKF
ncbi:MAG: alginate export family protein [bacterium]